MQTGENKAVLISIRPEWCEKIASGQKTIEVRKTRPKIETPFKCYIYCTEGKLNDDLWLRRKGYVDKICNGKVIGEFTCDEIYEFQSEFYSTDKVMNAIYIIAEDEDYPGVPLPTVIATNEEDSENFWICTQSCLTFDEIKRYVGYTRPETAFYGWHISDLVIYDQPRTLSDFRTGSSVLAFNEKGQTVYTGIKRPPQSWCYVEGYNDG